MESPKRPPNKIVAILHAIMNSKSNVLNPVDARKFQERSKSKRFWTGMFDRTTVAQDNKAAQKRAFKDKMIAEFGHVLKNRAKITYRKFPA